MEAHVLQMWEEVVGVLWQIIKDRENVVVNVSGTACLLENFPTDLLKKLQQYRSYSIGILRTDRGYMIRLVKTPPKRVQNTLVK